MTTDKHRDSTPVSGRPVNNCPAVKRFGLGTKLYSNGISVPEIIEKADGEYVRLDDYDLVVKHNQYLEALIAKLRGDKQSPHGPSSRLFGSRS